VPGTRHYPHQIITAYPERIASGHSQNQKDFDLKITCIASTFTHEIRYFEFIRPDDGRLITAFFQVVQKPDIAIGCFDNCEEAIELINNPPVLENTKNVMSLLQLTIPTKQFQQDKEPLVSYSNSARIFEKCHRATTSRAFTSNVSALPMSRRIDT
jgi:hypothetical protein